MSLPNNRETAIGQSGYELQAPERAASVERLREQLLGDCAELRLHAGSDHLDYVHVAVDRKERVINPVRVADPERRLNYAAAQSRNARQAQLDVAAQLLN